VDPDLAPVMAHKLVELLGGRNKTQEKTPRKDTRSGQELSHTQVQGMADDMFAPPVNRAMKVLDRSFFQKTLPASAARIFKPQDIARCRKELQLSRDTLPNNRIQPVRPDPDAERAQKGGKCLVLKPEVVHDGKPLPAVDCWV
jgi:hypothetical protein